jgi:urea transport system permease protein
VSRKAGGGASLQRDASPICSIFCKSGNDETDDVARQALLLALANLQLASPQADVRRKAVELLGQSDDPDVQAC